MKETLFADTPVDKVPITLPPAQFREVTTPTGGKTFAVKLQFLPPILSPNVAFPVPVGVPDIEYVTVSFPVLKLPAFNVAVRPVTPVELTICPACEPPLPPVYGTLNESVSKVTVPFMKVANNLPLAQFRAVMVPGTALTVTPYVQFRPPIFNAKLAVPMPAGVPDKVYVTLSAPFTKLPADKVAVSPVIPVEATT